MPRVSVILTCYNHIEFLPEAFASILAQTFDDYEILAIDDGSTDGSREWLRENATSARLIFNEKNLGTYASLNRGLNAADGEFIAILNDDDLWMPTKLERQVEFLDRNPHVGLVHTGGKFIDQKGQAIPGRPLGFPYPTFQTGNLLCPLIAYNRIIISAAMVRRAAYEKVGPFNEELFGLGDWEMWLRIAEHFEMGFEPQILTHYRVHGTNACLQESKMWQDERRIRKWIASRRDEYLAAPLDKRRVEEALAHNEACLGIILAADGEPAEARRHYAKSLKAMPFRFKSYVRWLATFLPKKAFQKTIRL